MFIKCSRRGQRRTGLRRCVLLTRIDPELLTLCENYFTFAASGSRYKSTVRFGPVTHNGPRQYCSPGFSSGLFTSGKNPRTFDLAYGAAAAAPRLGPALGAVGARSCLSGSRAKTRPRRVAQSVRTAPATLGRTRGGNPRAPGRIRPVRILRSTRMVEARRLSDRFDFSF
jgi:hypothetical protein